MRKSSRSISLALVGTALALNGCSGQPDNEWGEGDELAQAPAGVDPNAQGVDTANGQYHHSGGGSYNSPGRTAARVGGAIIGSQIGRNLGGGGSVAPGPGYSGGHPGGMGGGATAAPSSRGGFGSSAGHSSGGSASS